MQALTIALPNLATTEEWGRRIGKRLFPGSVVGLVGPLGAGKTHLARAIATGLGVNNPKVVTSPTFVLIQEYSGRLPIAHLDTYRLGSLTEFLDLGVQEYFDSDTVCLIEWADRVISVLPADHLRLILSIQGEHARQLQLEATGPRHGCLLTALQAEDVAGQ